MSREKMDNAIDIAPQADVYLPQCMYWNHVFQESMSYISNAKFWLFGFKLHQKCTFFGLKHRMYIHAHKHASNHSMI